MCGVYVVKETRELGARRVSNSRESARDGPSRLVSKRATHAHEEQCCLFSIAAKLRSVQRRTIEALYAAPKSINLCLNRVLLVPTDPHTGKALVIANQSRNMRSNTKRSDYSAVRAAYRSLAAFFIDLRPK